MPIILVSGTPGTGKTTLSKELSTHLDYYYFDLGDYIKTNKIVDFWDKKRDCLVIPIDITRPIIIKELNRLNSIHKGIIFDSHLSHLFKIKTDFCIITKCNLKDLEKRLFFRGYSSQKIRENLDSEIFDVCFIEAKELGYNPIIVETDKPYSLSSLIKLINL
jgi:adenylate kinase